jgi:hypothetical protein
MQKLGSSSAPGVRRRLAGLFEWYLRERSNDVKLRYIVVAHFKFSDHPPDTGMKAGEFSNCVSAYC